MQTIARLFFMHDHYRYENLFFFYICIPLKRENKKPHQAEKKNMRNTSPAAPTIRFRRWSRKAYAAFASIGRCVTIGCLRKNVADSSLSKQKAAGLPDMPDAGKRVPGGVKRKEGKRHRHSAG